MKAMILAAGRGERMRPLTDTTPKPLLLAGGIPLIAWHLRRLQTAGITDIVINHAWLGQKIEDCLGNGADYGVNICYSPEGETGLETAGGIATALEFLGDDPFLVINGDVLTNIDFHMARQQAEQLDAQNLLAHLWLVPNPPHNTQGDFGLRTDGKVQSDTAGAMPTTFSGVGVYQSALFHEVEKRKPAKLAPLLRKAMQLEQVSGQLHQGLWLDVGTPERLALADQLARAGALS